MSFWVREHCSVCLTPPPAMCGLDAQLGPTLYDPMDYIPPGSSDRGILQARILDWVAISFSGTCSRSRYWTCVSCVSCIGRQILYSSATWVALFCLPHCIPWTVSQSVQSLSRVWLCVTPWTAAHQASLSITTSWSSLRLMSIELVMDSMFTESNHLILCRPLLPPSIFPGIRVFSNESVHIRWQKYWSFSFSISPSNEYLRPISFRMGWLDRLAVQGTFKSLLQHHSSKLSVLQCSAFFIVQLSHAYVTTGKTIALTRWTFFAIPWK